MTHNLHITKKAEEDINAAVDYIEYYLLNPQAANNLLDKMEQQLGGLSFMPEIHQLVDDPVLNTWGVRFVRINHYLAFFIIHEDTETVFIIRFLHEKRNWIQILRNEPISFI